MLKLPRNNRGFTLIEITMAVALLGIAISIFYEFIGFNFKFLNSRNTEHDSYLQARIAMLKITEFMHKYQAFEMNETGDIVTAVDNDGNPVKVGDITMGIDFSEDISGSNCKYHYYRPPGDTGQLMSGGHVIAKNIRISVEPLNVDPENPPELIITGPAEAQLIRITVEAYPEDGEDRSAVKLSTILRLDHKRTTQ